MAAPRPSTDVAALRVRTGNPLHFVTPSGAQRLTRRPGSVGFPCNRAQRRSPADAALRAYPNKSVIGAEDQGDPFVSVGFGGALSEGGYISERSAGPYIDVATLRRRSCPAATCQPRTLDSRSLDPFVASLAYGVRRHLRRTRPSFHFIRDPGCAASSGHRARPERHRCRRHPVRRAPRSSAPGAELENW